MRTLDHCTLLTVDGQDRWYPQGRIVIDGKRIVALGRQDDVPLQGERVDMHGALVMPGLINTHTHSHSSIFRSLADDMELMDWLKKGVWPMEQRMGKQQLAAAVRLSCLEYLESGITTIADQIYHGDTVAEATQQSGLRSFLAASVFSGPGPAPGTEDTFADAKRFVEKWQGSSEETRIYPCLGPHAPYSVEEPLLKALVAYAGEKALLVHIHISETAEENRQIQAKTGLSPTAWLAKMGLLERPVLAAHSIHLSKEDLDLYAHHGVAVTYNPVSNLKLVSGIMPMKAMQERGIVMGIGTDGAQSNNTMDLLRDLRTGTLIQKQWTEDPTFLPVRQAVRMATIEGAKALRFEAETGSLEVGKRADLIALDAASPRLCPMHRQDVNQLYSLVCYATCGADVTDVMVDGQWLMRGRQAQTLDAERVRAEAQQASEEICPPPSDESRGAAVGKQSDSKEDICHGTNDAFGF